MNSEKIFKSLGINGGAKRSTVDAVARAEALIKIKDNLSVTKLMKYEPILRLK